MPTVDDARKLRGYSELSDTAKVFVEAYIRCDRDPVAACMLAHSIPENMHEKARLLASSRMKDPKVMRFLDLLYGEEEKVPTKNEYLRHLWRQIQLCRGKEATTLMQLYADIMGWKGGKGKEDEPESKVPNSLKDLMNE